MSIKEAIERVRQAKADLIANREADALIIAHDQLALIKLRITGSGENAGGGKFAGYTPGYARQREKRGFQIEHFDFTRTGQAWANIRPRVEKSTIFACTVVIEGASQLTKDKMSGQFKKRGNLLELSQTEIDLVRAANRKRLSKYLTF